jgi:hypothetical protein
MKDPKPSLQSYKAALAGGLSPANSAVAQINNSLSIITLYADLMPDEEEEEIKEAVREIQAAVKILRKEKPA